MPAQLVDIFATGFDYGGDPVNGGTVEVYEAGTSTPAYVWYDRAKTSPTTTGVSSFTLDTNGRKDVYGDGLYKFVVKDADSVTLRTIDNYDVNEVLETADLGLPFTSLSDYASSVVSGDWGLALQAAIDASSDGDVIVVPKGVDATLKTPVSAISKKLKIVILGTITDALTTHTANFNDLTLDGKGVLNFSGGDIEIEGNGFDSLYGGLGVGGVSQVERPFIYAYNCDSIKIKNLEGSNFLKQAVWTVLCDVVEHRDCRYDVGQFVVIHTHQSLRIIVDNVTVTNAKYGAITVSNRADFSEAVLAHSRPQNVTFSNCKVVGIGSTNSYAGGISADSCDHVTAYGNFVDGTDTATIGCSWASSTNVRCFGNKIINFSNTANGTYTYAGIGMELDETDDSEFFGNHFEEVLTGYLMLTCNNVKVDGTYICEAAREAQKSTGAFDQASFVVMGGKTAELASNNITISGTTDGGNCIVNCGALVDGLFIRDIKAKDYFSRGFVLGSAGDTQLIENVNIRDINIDEPGPAKRIIGAATTSLGRITVDGLVAKAAGAKPGSNQSLIYLGEPLTGAKITVKNCDVDNYDHGLKLAFDSFVDVAMSNNDFRRMTESTLAETTGTKIMLAFENNRLDGRAVSSKGDGSLDRYGAKAGTPSGTFLSGVHQYLYIDPTAGARGKVAAISGTQGTYSEGLTIALSSGQTVGTLSAASTVLRIGQYITIAGAGVAAANLATRIVDIDDTTITVADTASTTVTTAAISFTAPTFIEF